MKFCVVKSQAFFSSVFCGGLQSVKGLTERGANATGAERLLATRRISVYGADRAGIVSKVTTVLAEAGLNILDLESDVAGDDEKPIYIMHIEGEATESVKALESASQIVKEENGIEAELVEIDTLIG